VICASCKYDVTPQGLDISPPLAVCPECGQTLVILDGDACRVAKRDDTIDVSDDKRIALRKLRPR